MNLFTIAKNKKNTKSCQNCGLEFTPDKRNINRGWGICCGKSCAAIYRNKLRKMSTDELIKEVRDMRLSKLGL